MDPLAREFSPLRNVERGRKLRGERRPSSMEIAKLVKTALEETRMLILGAQILLGFELSGVFRNGLTDLPLHACLLDGVALLLMVVTVVLIIAPETYHHYIEYDADTRTLSPAHLADGRLRIAALRAQSGWRPVHCRELSAASPPGRPQGASLLFLGWAAGTGFPTCAGCKPVTRSERRP